MFVTTAYAQAQTPAQSSSFFGNGSLVQFAPFILIFVVFYFLLIRPQQQKQKQMRSMLAALRRGDRIVTAGGIIGTVAKVINENEVAVDISENTRVRVVRSTITQVLARTEPAGGKGKDRSGADQEEKETEVAKSD